MPPSILIVAGEASADQHGAKVLARLRADRPDVTSFGVGGEALCAEGLTPVARAEDISVAGLTEVLFAIPRILGIMRRLERTAMERRPQVAVLIDLPDFNLRLAKRLKRLGIPVVYYISPQVWAWRPKRVEQIRRIVDKMLVILPFEEAFYRQHGIDAEFVGHPLVEDLPQTTNALAARVSLGLGEAEGPIVALLPGSREKEVARHLPTMLLALRLLRDSIPKLRAVLPIASTIARDAVLALIREHGADVTVVNGRATEALIASDAAVVCSGTATLQTALLERPMVVVYRVSWLTYQIVRRLVRVGFISLVNLIAGRELVRELIQRDMTAANIASAVRPLLVDRRAHDALQGELHALREKLGGPGAAVRVAQVVAGYLPAPGANTP
ncbi:MAG: lipid-A-disaccharide synthase [Myxococcota bacterium]